MGTLFLPSGSSSGRVVVHGKRECSKSWPPVATATPAPTAAPSSSKLDLSVLDEIIDILEEDFVEPDRIDRELLYEGAINGIFAALNDPHSVYIDPNTYAISRDRLTALVERNPDARKRMFDFMRQRYED